MKDLICLPAGDTNFSDNHGDYLVYNQKNLLICKGYESPLLDIGKFKKQYLYKTSDDKIEKGDFVLVTLGNTFALAKAERIIDNNLLDLYIYGWSTTQLKTTIDCKLIIATNNTSLNKKGITLITIEEIKEFINIWLLKPLISDNF